MPIHTEGNLGTPRSIWLPEVSPLASVRASICTQALLLTTSVWPHPDLLLCMLNTVTSLVFQYLKASNIGSVPSRFFDTSVRVLQIGKITQRK